MVYSPKTARQRSENAAPIGTEKIDKNGYLVRKVATGRSGWRRVHRIVMAEKLGRALKRGEVVHHINHDRRDNRPENLQIMTTKEHLIHHHKGKRGTGGYKRPPGKWAHQHDACRECGTTTIPHQGKGLCKACYAKVYIEPYRQRKGYYEKMKTYHQKRRQQTHLSSGKWAMYYDACIECGTTKRRHAGHGLCNACSCRQRYALMHHVH